MSTPEPLVHLDGDHPIVQILLALELPDDIKLMAGQVLNQLLDAPDLDALHHSSGLGNGYALGVMAADAVDDVGYEQLVDLYDQAANYRAEEKGWL